MHDFMLAKSIADKLLEEAGKNNVKKVKLVRLEIGSVALEHDGFPEHVDDVDPDNLQFALKGICRGTVAEDAVFEIKKVEGHEWKLVDIETEDEPAPENYGQSDRPWKSRTS